MEVKTIKIDGYDYELVTKKVQNLKPVMNKKGILYADALMYLVRVLPYNEPSLNIILGLTSFAKANNLSKKQADLAKKFIKYWKEQGVL